MHDTLEEVNVRLLFLSPLLLVQLWWVCRVPLVLKNVHLCRPFLPCLLPLFLCVAKENSKKEIKGKGWRVDRRLKK